MNGTDLIHRGTDLLQVKCPQSLPRICCSFAWTQSVLYFCVQHWWHSHTWFTLIKPNKTKYIFILNTGLIYISTMVWQTWLYIHALKTGTLFPQRTPQKKLNPRDTKPGQVNSLNTQTSVIKLRYSDVILFPELSVIKSTTFLSGLFRTEDILISFFNIIQLLLTQSFKLS